MGQTERRSYSQNNQNYRCKKFSDNVNRCGLMDIGCSGLKFTWSNNRQGMSNTMERLDRALCNAEWRTVFPKGAVCNLPRTYSDHSPIMVHTEDNLFSAASNSLTWNKDLIVQYNKTLFQEEVLWFQKSRANWITQGERITKFFHTSAINRRKKLRIDALKDEHGEWINNPLLVKNHIQNYFISLFNSEPVSNLDHWCNITTHKISHDDNNLLLRNISTEEIWKAVKIISAFKAPGRDGFQAIFYHKFWDVIEVNVCDFIKNCFQSKSIPPVVNQTLIALFPKTVIPENIKQFRPISLCNVSYKILSKILVNRIRPLLQDLVGPTQSSFIPGRSTHDNIIITQELIHTLRKKKDLGRYLGVPLIHSRISRNIYNGTIEKIQKKLSSWKAKALSLAGRTTVIQSVSSSIPSYIMQISKLPQSICKQIDKLNRNFLWGDLERRKKVHLVNWKQVCKVKQEGALGLRRAEDQNLALLTKLG
ncbi:uncharacterized protein LOC114294405 [Camellia sinensis]|uniref:uncharacterized protein LOC114294405 n=1 Tax=Camellia sinensis TaxID=4442 RepID=UPI001035A73A|nr:uncharacterized protein LOC114294405 [Camellia sinensis]